MRRRGNRIKALAHLPTQGSQRPEGRCLLLSCPALHAAGADFRISRESSPPWGCSMHPVLVLSATDPCFQLCPRAQGLATLDEKYGASKLKCSLEVLINKGNQRLRESERFPRPSFCQRQSLVSRSSGQSPSDPQTAGRRLHHGTWGKGTAHAFPLARA